MHARSQQPGRDAQRPPSHPNAVDSAIYAIVALCTIGAWAFTCTRSSDVGQCMRDGAPALLGVLLQAGALVGAVRAGYEVSRRMHSALAGFCCGALLFFLGSGLLSVVGLSPLAH